MLFLKAIFNALTFHGRVRFLPGRRKADNSCSFCHEDSETLQHVLFACPVITAAKAALAGRYMALPANYATMSFPDSLLMGEVDQSPTGPLRALGLMIFPAAVWAARALVISLAVPPSGAVAHRYVTSQYHVIVHQLGVGPAVGRLPPPDIAAP